MTQRESNKNEEEEAKYNDMNYFYLVAKWQKLLKDIKKKK